MSSSGTSRAPLILAVVALVAALTLALWFLTRPDEPILRFNAQALDAVAPQAQAIGTTKRSTTADPTWVEKNAAAAGIPVPAMRAYADAALRMGKQQPDCGIGWTTLAGIGYVESVHGTLGGSILLDDGHSDPAIIGPALDGRGDVASIPSNAWSQQWHGDPDWDHAVGPMQFIPSTWEAWASDGDHDGNTDPNDIDDAAYAAARYLCADGRGMGGAGWSEAILSYNRSAEYVRQVYAAATAYAQRTA